MEEQKSNSKIISSVIFSCTKNITLLVAVIYSLYLLGSLIINNWSSVGSTINELLIFLMPAYTFVLEHFLILLIGNSILFFWLLCIFIKLEKAKIEVSVFFDWLLVFLFFTESIFLCVTSKMLTGYLSFVFGLLGVFMLFLVVVLFVSFVFHMSGKLLRIADKEEEQKLPEQLELFNDKK